MKLNCQAIRNGLVALSIAMAAQDASATAIASVERNVFTLVPGLGTEGIVFSLDSQTDTVAETELGNASVNFTGPIVTIAPDGTRFSAEIGGTAIAQPDGYALGVRTFEVTVAFTNVSGSDLDFVNIRTLFSAFNPGGPAIGAQVDDSTREFARFESSQSGPGIGDSHHCDTRVPNGFFFPSPPPSVRCGVNSPDESELGFAILDLDQNETVTRTFTLSLLLEASSIIDIPEPHAFAIVSASLLGLVGFRLFKKYASGVTES